MATGIEELFLLPRECISKIVMVTSREKINLNLELEKKLDLIVRFHIFYLTMVISV